MAEDLRMALLQQFRKAELDKDVNFVREGVRVMAQHLMELEVASMWEPRSTSEPPVGAASAMAIRSPLGHSRRRHRAPDPTRS